MGGEGGEDHARRPHLPACMRAVNFRLLEISARDAAAQFKVCTMYCVFFLINALR